MGEYSIPEQPFKFVLPDDWEVGVLEASSKIVASSPDNKTTVHYQISDYPYLGALFSLPGGPPPPIESPELDSDTTKVYFTLNGMPCVMLHSINQHPAALIGAEPISYDLVRVWVQNQSVVLRVSIFTSPVPTGDAWPTSLLVVSGIHPGGRVVTKVEHDFKKIIDALTEKKPYTWCLNTLKTISETLKEDSSYENLGNDLDKIRNFLKKEWGIQDPEEVKTEPQDTKTTAPPAPDSKSKRELSSTCRKCGASIHPDDKFCRECGVITKAKPKRWSPKDRS